jgi:hypothetical protein
LLTLSAADNIDPALQASYVAKADYDELKARYDTLQQSTQSGTQGQGKSRKRARLAQPKPEQTMDETMPMREVSSTPVDEKGRKKRSMKLEVGHLLEPYIVAVLITSTWFINKPTVAWASCTMYPNSNQKAEPTCLIQRRHL